MHVVSSRRARQAALAGRADGSSSLDVLVSKGGPVKPSLASSFLLGPATLSDNSTLLLRLLRLLLPFAPVRRLLLASDSRSFLALGSFVHDLTLGLIDIACNGLVERDQINDDEANGECMILCVGL